MTTLYLYIVRFVNVLIFGLNSPIPRARYITVGLHAAAQLDLTQLNQFKCLNLIYCHDSDYDLFCVHTIQRDKLRHTQDVHDGNNKNIKS